MKIGVCAKCGQRRFLHSRGRCRGCYAKLLARGGLPPLPRPSPDPRTAGLFSNDGGEAPRH